MSDSNSSPPSQNDSTALVSSDVIVNPYLPALEPLLDRNETAAASSPAKQSDEKRKIAHSDDASFLTLRGGSLRNQTTTYSVSASFAHFKPSPDRFARIEKEAEEAKRRRLSVFTDEFSYKIIQGIGLLVIVYVTDTAKGTTGWLTEIFELLNGQDSSPSACRTRRSTPFNSLFGPYHRVNDDGKTLMETRPRQRKSYAARCLVLIPKLDDTGSFTEDSVTADVQAIADYCNRNYRKGMERRRDEKKETYDITPRTFGVSTNPNLTDSPPNGPHLSDHITRDSCVDFIQRAYGLGDKFYSDNPERAEALVAPPYRQRDAYELGYPFSLYTPPEEDRIP